MDWLQFWSSVIGALAWPVAVVVLGFMFKDRLERLLEKVRRAKGAGFELDFSAEVKKVADEAQQVVATTITVADQDHVSKENLSRLIREHPAALIMESWNKVERAMGDLIGAAGVYVKPIDTKNPALWPTALVREKLLTPEVAGLIPELCHLRNRVAHASDWEPTVADALEFFQTATLVTDTLKASLRRYLESLPNRDDNEV